jgi:hypothetical protein
VIKMDLISLYFAQQAQNKANQAETDAQTGITDASNALTQANLGVTNAATAQSAIKPVNILRYNPNGTLLGSPIVPTASWTSGTGITVPTNLANATDGILPTTPGTGNPTGYGTATLGTAGQLGMFFFDLGANFVSSNYSAEISVIMGSYCAVAGTVIYATVNQSPDNWSTTQYCNENVMYCSTGAGSANEKITISEVIRINQRYFNISLTTNAACTASARLYQAFANLVGGV